MRTARRTAKASSRMRPCRLPIGDEGRNQEEVRRRAQVFAYAGDNRYAITDIAKFDSNALPERRKRLSAPLSPWYRPTCLYRPSQTVNLRVVMTEGRPGAYRLPAGKEALLTVAGPRGELLRKNIKMGAHGTYNDSFTLPARAESGRIGTFGVETLPEDRKTPGIHGIYGAATFRIRGVQEAGVHGDGDPGQAAGSGRRTDADDDHGAVLFRRAGGERESTLQSDTLVVYTPLAVSVAPGLV